MAFNSVKTQAEAEAFKFLKDQSTVLHTLESNEIKVNGVNVITKTPEPGDVLCITNRLNQDKSLKPAQDQDIVWIKGSTVSFSEWPSVDGHDIYEPVGVCYKVRGGKAYCRFRSEVARRWAEADRWLVTNSASLVKSGTVTVSATSGCSSQSFTISTPSSVKDLCAKIQAGLRTLNNTTVSCQYVGPHDYNDLDENGQYTGNDGVMIINARFTADAWNTVSLSVGGTNATMERCIGRDIPADSTNYRANGGQQYWGGCNFYRFYDYYSQNGSTDTSIINTGTPMNEATFDALAKTPSTARGVYGTYKNYLRSCMVQWPTAKGANGRFFDKGHEFTQKLARAKYISMESGSPVVTHLYGPAHYCGVEVSANALGVESGQWWLPSSGEMIELMQDVTYGTSEFGDPTGVFNMDKLDPVNTAIYHLNNNCFDTEQGFHFEFLSASENNYATYLRRLYSSSGNVFLQYLYQNVGLIGALGYWTRDGADGMPITAVNISQ